MLLVVFLAIFSSKWGISPASASSDAYFWLCFWLLLCKDVVCHILYSSAKIWFWQWPFVWLTIAVLSTGAAEKSG
jgi:hypothetical protein